METTTNVNPPRKSLKKPLLIAGAAAVVILGGLGTAYAKFDLFKSAKTIYLQSEAESMLKFSSDMSKAYGEYEDYMKPYLEKPVHSTTELSDITVDAALPDPQAQKVLELLKSAKIVMQSNIDEQKNQQQGNFEVHLKDKKLATIEYFLNDTQFGFRLPEFYSKYGYMDLKDRDALNQKFGQELPKRFLTYRDLMEAVRISQDEVKSTLTPYAMLYAESIKDSQVTINKDASFTEEGFKESAREITVTFTEEEAKALATKLAEKAKADQKLFDLIYTRYHNVSTLMADSGYAVEEISKEEFKKNYDQGFDDLLKDINDSTTESKEQLKMVVLVDGDHQILSRKLMFTGKDNKEEQLFFSGIAYQKGADRFYRYALHNPEDPKNGELSYTYKATEQNGKTNGKLSVMVKDNEQPALDLATTFESVKEGQKVTGKYDFALVVADEYSEPVALNGNITVSETTTDNGRDSDGSVKINFDNPTPDMPKGFSLKVKSKQEFGKALEIPAMTADNAINLANLTDEQMMEIQQEAGTAAQKFMQENAELVQQFMMP
ncbi:hypothetical protein BAG01nite_35690 [Brevibacillus agri]|uniref:Uncharacterized protein n=1 Tax=Brevibacillus agri TaxID=51101 RepID=A0A3M8AMY5_9BACL|nr:MULTISPECIES: DUF6583 family protein [Brevibacillus]ELK40341.1 hypothetical protein D478_19699 [Brevibacillus agri BAB-2500]EJL47501.1 hypothetical protein PMI08_00308 [Brevibacillus sp. CF112]MED1643947.1 hypothetical protein [Brevibacillus agri]MED1654508.1 hypothetical protein [Brevibacillus agri]MED1686057.1 hypothetical protein [Brevibacillus agri]